MVWAYNEKDRNQNVLESTKENRKWKKIKVQENLQAKRLENGEGGAAGMKESSEMKQMICQCRNIKT